MDDSKFEVFQHIRSFIETEISRANFTVEDKAELVQLLSEDIPQIVTEEGEENE